jgi:hypothetical protein
MQDGSDIQDVMIHYGTLGRSKKHVMFQGVTLIVSCWALA